MPKPVAELNETATQVIQTIMPAMAWPQRRPLTATAMRKGMAAFKTSPSAEAPPYSTPSRSVRPQELLNRKLMPALMA